MVTRKGETSAVIAPLCGCYLGVTAAFAALRYLRIDYQRRVLFELPLVLESVVLLVESGLGILPSIQKVVSQPGRSSVKRLLKLTYELSAKGIPFAQALEIVAGLTEIRVLQHALLHLDISGTEGGELIPSLRSLSDYTFSEWRLSVEHRVKRLENLVVFPVFAAVIGLMLLTAAVPLVPVLEFSQSLRAGRSIAPQQVAQP